MLHLDRQRVFISYAHRDGATLAQRLKRDLEDKDFDVWLDTTRLLGGSSWSNEIERAISRADTVLALLSVGSFESNVCRGEQIRALESKKCVIPLLVHTGADRPVYLAAKQYRDFSDDTQYPLRFKDLLGDIKHRRSAYIDEKYRQTRYDTRPPLPPNFVPRPAELELLRKAIISDAAEKSVALVALAAMGGIGKTVLAQALCFDATVLAAFPDGVVWAKIGETPTDAEMIDQMKEVARGIGEAATGFDTKEQSAKLLRSLLSNKAVLLVLDDVWRSQHVYDFLATEARRYHILITTRDTEVAADIGAQIQNLDVMGEELSRQVLSKYAGVKESAMPPAASAMIARCHGLPLALAMIGAEVNGQPSEYWEDIANDFAIRLQLLQKKLPNYAHPGLVAAMDVSLNRLDETVRERCLKLAVVPEDTMVPELALETFWRQSPASVRATVAVLTRKSLAKLGPGKLLSLHDVQLAHLRAHVADLPALHQDLLEAYKQQCSNGWDSGPNDGYFFNHVAYHLREAGHARELGRLLLDCHWHRKKLELWKVADLLVDFDVALSTGRQTQLLRSTPICVPPWRTSDEAIGATGTKTASERHAGKPLRLVQGALRLSSNVLAKDPDQFPSQMVGRLLLYCDVPAIAEFAAQVAAGARTRWLRPLRPALLAPGTALLRTLSGHLGSVTAVAVTPDGQRAVSGSNDKTLKVWDLPSGRELQTLSGHSDSVTAVAVTPDGKRAASGSNDKTLKVWDLASGRELQTLCGHSDSVTAVAVTPDGRRAISASWDKTLKVWNLTSGQELRTLSGHLREVTAVAVTPDGRWAVSASYDKTLKVWNLTSGQELRTLSGHSREVTAVAVTPDGQWAVSASYDDTLRVWDLASGHQLRTISGHSREVTAVAVTPDGQRAVSASYDKTLRVWDLASGHQLRTISGHSNISNAVAVMPDGQKAISACVEHTLMLWNLASDRQLRSISSHSLEVTAVATTADGKLAISTSWDKTLKLWDLASGSELRTLFGHSEYIMAVAVTADGKRAISASYDKTLKVWDLASGRALWTLSGHSGLVIAVAVTPNGQQAVSASSDQSLRVWDLVSGSQIGILAGHSREVTAVAVTPDGQRAVSGSNDKTLKVWDLAGGRELQTLRGHSDAVTAVAVTPDGQRAVSGSNDKTLKVWDLTGGRELQTLRGHSDAVTAVAVTSDGRRAVSASADRTVRLWDIKTGKLLAIFTCDSAARCCTTSDRLKVIVAGDAWGHVHFLQIEEPNTNLS